MNTNLLPYMVELPFGSEKHRKVLEYVIARVKQARQRRTDREDKWAESEDLFSGYVTEKEVDAVRRGQRNAGVPQYTTITIPYSYATLMTAHTYWTSVFLGRDPVLQVQGMSGEAQTSEQAVEAMMNHFLIAGKNLVPYYVWLLDQGKYGEGILGMSWDVQRSFIPELRITPKEVFGVAIPGTKKRAWTSLPVIGYEGIKLFNVRPQDFLFDPTVTLQNFQEGEFAGHDSFYPLLKLQDGEAMGKFFNVDKVEGRTISNRPTHSRTGIASVLPSSTLPMLGGNPGSTSLGVDLTEITIELCPRQLGLANRDYLEKWVFTIANDLVIIGAQPQGWYHNAFMYDTLEHEIEGYNTSKRGMLEMLRPLNQTMDWLINTHFYNVRKTLNNEWVYDPSKLVSKDVEAPGPGKLIRVRPEAYGTDVRTAFYQVQQQDVTQNHVKDMMLIIEMMQRLTGVNDTVMGMVNKNRKTATEVRSSSSFAVNRLKTQCEYYSAMGFSPHTSRMIKVAQQMLRGRPKRFYRMVGNSTAALAANGPFLNVGPDDIAGEFDYIPVDGTMPIDRQAQATLFTQMLQMGMQIPPVTQAYDWVKLFAYNAELGGIKNLDRFKVQVLPDQQVLAGAQAGNFVSAGEATSNPNLINNGAGQPAPGE